ncbi:hypothetical protein vseg_011733 [Gypsophila vaccaria]
MVIIDIPTAKGICDTLDERYTIANGAGKFELNRETYEAPQNGRSIEEYFIELKAEEIKLFFFLNGLDKGYGILRSNIILMDPLPTIDHVVSLMLQEEQQTSYIGGAKNQEISVMKGKRETEKEKCAHCGKDNHKS